MANRTLILAGAALIVVGCVSFAYQGISYSKQEEVVKFGDLKITAETKETIPLPPVLGGIALIAGLAFIYLGTKK